jgi:hypothetical protein
MSNYEKIFYNYIYKNLYLENKLHSEILHVTEIIIKLFNKQIINIHTTYDTDKYYKEYTIENIFLILKTLYTFYDRNGILPFIPKWFVYLSDDQKIKIINKILFDVSNKIIFNLNKFLLKEEREHFKITIYISFYK